jgi:hypothetical protein
MKKRWLPSSPARESGFVDPEATHEQLLSLRISEQAIHNVNSNFDPFVNVVSAQGV